MCMITNKLPKSKKYILTKLVKKKMSSWFEEIQFGKFDSLYDCADFIMSNNESWYDCKFGYTSVNNKLWDIIEKLRAIKSDFS